MRGKLGLPLHTFLEIVRLTAGEAGTDAGLLDLAHVLQEEVRRHRPLATQRGLTMSFDAPAETLYVQASEQELGQAVAELLDNAIKFNRPGGHVSVAVNRTGGELAIRVADTGIGIAEAEVSRWARMSSLLNLWPRRFIQRRSSPPRTPKPVSVPMNRPPV